MSSFLAISRLSVALLVEKLRVHLLLLLLEGQMALRLQLLLPLPRAGIDLMSRLFYFPR
jgi:hypothetical protein